MGNYHPPYEITDKILMLTASIAEKSGRIMERYHGGNAAMDKEGRIRAVHAVLETEGNRLSVGEMREIIEERVISARERQIREVQNTYAAYLYIEEADLYNVSDLRNAHGILMEGLSGEPGTFRQGEKGVFNSSQFFMAPPARFVPGQIQELFGWMEEHRGSVHPLILAAVFHYEFLFLHPFTDGNNRMAKIWQNAILTEWNPFFASLAPERQMEKAKERYYETVAVCHMERKITAFIEFMLEQIDIALDEIKKEPKEPAESISKYVKKLLEVMEEGMPYTANEILELLHLKSKDALRKNYLNPALENGLIQMTIPDAPKSKNQRYRKR